MKKTTLILLSIFQLAALPSLWAQDRADSFYEVSKIQEIKITFEQDNWQYLLDSLRFNGADFLLGDVEINGQKLSDIGLRYEESRSFQPGNKRNSLYLKLNFIDKKQNYQGRSSVNLSSALRDPSMVREVLGYEIARKYMPAPKANYAKIIINGSYYGLFVNVEPIDNNFLNDNFGNDKGTLVRCAPNLLEPEPSGCKSEAFGSLQFDESAKCYLHNFELISDSGWDDLIELTRVLNKSPENIEKVLHVDYALWMLAFNNVLVNLSSYSGRYSENYYLYRDPLGRFTPVLYNLNLCFGSYKNTGGKSDLKLKELQEMDPLLHVDNAQKPLISQLLSNEQYKRMYLAHIRSIVNDVFRKDQYIERINELQGIIRKAFEEDANRYYALEDFNNSLEKTIGKTSRIPGLRELMSPRTDYLKRNLLMAALPPEVEEVNVIGREQFSSKPVSSFKVQAKVGRFPKKVFLYYRYSDDAAYQMIEMMDDGNHIDGEANDGIFGARIVPEEGQKAIQYYIYAENVKAGAFSPSRYTKEQHTSSLEELNN